MFCADIRDLFRNFVKLGFSLESVSIATQIPVEELQKMAETNCLPKDNRRVIYLGFFLMLLYDAKPSDDYYFTSLLEALTKDFKISKQAIANYLEIPVDELDSFRESPRRHEIELNLMHLYTTFIRDAHYTVPEIDK